MGAAATAIQQFALDLASKIQRDLVPSQIIAALSVPGVYEVTLNSPAYTQLMAGTVGQLHQHYSGASSQHRA